MRKAVFLDKDGTLVKDLPYNVDPHKVALYPEAVLALTQLTRAGFLPVLISNQPGVAQARFDERDLQSLGYALQTMLQNEGVTLFGFYYCPHHPQGRVARYTIQCECRKPRPGLILQAARALKVDLAASWMVGDILHDVEAGNRAGCRSVLVDRGNETQWQYGAFRQPAFIAADLKEAADCILASAELELSSGGVL